MMDTIHVLITISILAELILGIYCVNAPILEYCAGDTFSPSCQKEEVLLIHQARYGRMKIGRCVTIDVGYLGCYFDALAWMDKQCSGKRSCEVRIQNHELNEQLQCLPPDYTPYLEVSSSCRKVIWMSSAQCDSTYHIAATESKQYLSSDVTSRLGCGSESAPWLLSAEEGQRINTTLIDFYWEEGGGGNKECKVEYGYVIDGGKSDMVTLCGGKARKRNLATSTGNMAQIVLKEDVVKDYRFLIEFNAIGCPNLKPPRDSWTSREGDTITVGCHGDPSSQWEVTCKDSRWIGHIGSCIVVADTGAAVMNAKSDKVYVPKVVTLALIGGVTAVLCCVAVTAILAYFFVRKYKNIKKREEYYLPTMKTLQKHNTSGTLGFRTVQAYRPVSTAEGQQAGIGWSSIPHRWHPSSNHGNPMMTSVTGSLGGGADEIYDIVATGEELQRT